MVSQDSTEAVKVRLFGREYAIRGHGKRDYVEKLAAFINERADEIRKRSAVVSTVDLAILTLLNVTDECFQLKAIHGEVPTSEEETKQRSETIEPVVS